jgi:hypothetical protein
MAKESRFQGQSKGGGRKDKPEGEREKNSVEEVGPFCNKKKA